MEACKISTNEDQATSIADPYSAPFFEQFGERYGMTQREKEVVRLLVLFGFKNEDMARVLRTTVETVNNHLDCTMGKTRTHSARELQALFLRYLMQKTNEKKAESM